MPSKTKEYILIYATGRYNSNHCLFIQKQKPPDQAGRLNLPGGKIEKGENSFAAAVRELKEETGVSPYSFMEKRGFMYGEDYWITFFACDYDDEVYYGNECLEKDYEEPFIFGVDSALLCTNIMPNLRITLPLLKCNIKNFYIKNPKVINKEDQMVEAEIRIEPK